MNTVQRIIQPTDILIKDVNKKYEKIYIGSLSLGFTFLINAY